MVQAIININKMKNRQANNNTPLVTQDSMSLPDNQANFSVIKQQNYQRVITILYESLLTRTTIDE